MASFVLVHGGFFGGWCWARVARLLRQAGHDVHTPTLTGFGQSSHLLSPEIGLETHVLDIVNLLKFEDLREVILVGHSYGGMVVGLAADRVPERIGQIVYLDAFVPENGKSMSDIQLGAPRKLFRELVDSRGEGWYLPPVSPDSDTLGVVGDEEAEWMARNLTPIPYKTLIDPAELKGELPDHIRRSFIYCTVKTAAGSFKAFAEKAKNDPDWRYSEIVSGHSAMVTAPEAVSRELLALAG